MSTSLSAYKTASTAAQTTYLEALQTLYGAMIDLEALTATVENIGGGPQVHFSSYSRDAWQSLQTLLEHPLAAPRATNLGGALKATAGTLTSSPTLTVAAVPSWVVAGMVVTDLTSGAAIGTVSAAAPQGTSITLAANAANAVASGDILAFAMPNARIADQIAAATKAYIANWSGA